MRSAIIGAISVNRTCETPLSVIVLLTMRRLATVSTLARVMSFSAIGRTCLALARVVTTRPCSKSWVARLDRMRRWWAGLPPRRAPFFGVGIFVLLVCG